MTLALINVADSFLSDSRELVSRDKAHLFEQELAESIAREMFGQMWRNSCSIVPATLEDWHRWIGRRGGKVKSEAKTNHLKNLHERHASPFGDRLLSMHKRQFFTTTPDMKFRVHSAARARGVKIRTKTVDGKLRVYKVGNK